MSKKISTKPFYNSEIPSDWDIKELGEIANFLDGRRRPIKDSDRAKIQGGYPYYGASGIIDYVNDYIFDEELILLGEDGANIINRSSPLAFRVSGKIWVNNHAHVLKPKNGTDIGYLTEFLESIKYDKYNTGTAQPKLNKEVCSSIPVILPPLPEQKAIAHILSLMDTAINKNNLLIAKKELQKKWLMQVLLSGKKRLKGFEKEKWKILKLGNAFEFIKSYSISRDGLTKENSDDLIYCIHYGDIHAFYATEFLDFSIQQSIPQIIYDTQIINEKDYLKDGDIIMADASEDYEGVGEVVEVLNLKNKIAVGGLHTIVLRGNSNFISNGFRGYLFSSETVRNVMRKMATGTSVYSVTKTTLQNLSLKIPNSLKEQTAIAQVLQAADKEIQLLKTKTE